MVMITYGRCLDKNHAAMNEKFDEYFYNGLDLSKVTGAETINNELLVKAVAEHVHQPEFLQAVLHALQTATANNAKYYSLLRAYVKPAFLKP
jgi:recombinational DNA repair protein (RecF pathway)